MKSAYEIAMERLNEAAPTIQLSPGQKKAIAELESTYAAKIAAREIALNAEIAKTAEVESTAALREQLMWDRKKLRAELAEKKEQIRQKRP